MVAYVLRRISGMLDTLGHLLHIDAHYFAKNSFIVFLGQGINILRGIVTGFIVARYIEKDLFGEYQFMLSIVGMISIVSISGLNTAVTRAWAKKTGFSLSRVCLYQARLCAIGSLMLLISIPFLSFYAREELRILFLVAALLLPVPPYAMLKFGGYIVGKARFDLALLANAIASIITIVCTLVIVFWYPSSLLLLILTMSVPSVIYILLSIGITPPAEENPQETKGIIRYGWQLTIASLPNEISWYIDKLLISQFFGLSQLALFSVAQLIPEQSKIFVKQFSPIAFPRQAAGNDGWHRRKHLMKIVISGTGIFLVGIGAYWILAPFILPVLFPKYDAAQMIFLSRIAALSLIVIPAGYCNQYLEARGMISPIRAINIVSSVTYVILLFALLLWLGMVGAIIARGVTRLISASMAVWYMRYLPLEIQTAEQPS